MRKESALFRKKWLEWALNFPIINLKKRSAGELHYLKSEALFFCSSDFRFQNEEDFFKRLTLERYKKVEGKINLAKLQETLRPAVRFIGKFSTLPDRKIRPIFSILKRLTNVGLALEMNTEDGYFQIDYETDDYLSLSLLNLTRLIEHLPIDSLIKCKGCCKYFIDLTERKKKYCNSLCAARYISRTKREDLKYNHPRKYKTYLKKQRERMRSMRKAT